MMLQALWLLLSPVLPGGGGTAAELVLGLAVAAAALLIVVAAAAIALPVSRPPAGVSRARSRITVRPRLSDPDAAGRPRSRAPSVCPAA
ncbi:DUF6412 domain-containing protein [Actinoplanes sp. NBRC 103695]|uniref:DUF6412 domain-containing protein n=1 Tax=Actinoplanes sp. NBRC 103695 TaxID=3032202 RepID=UPI002554969B|nr:DUF6412 domain-containing protein [Actinoplanes sp. NBRC 103695]